MKLILWILPLLGSLISGLIILFTIGGGASAPQEAAGYAMACAFSVVPYVFVRSIMAMSENETAVHVKKIAQLLERQHEDTKPRDR